MEEVRIWSRKFIPCVQAVAAIGELNGCVVEIVPRFIGNERVLDDSSTISLRSQDGSCRVVLYSLKDPEVS